MRRRLRGRLRQTRLKLRNAVVRRRKPGLQPLDLFLLVRQRLGEIVDLALLLGDMRLQAVEAIFGHGALYSHSMVPGGFDVTS